MVVGLKWRSKTHRKVSRTGCFSSKPACKRGFNSAVWVAHVQKTWLSQAQQPHLCFLVAEREGNTWEALHVTLVLLNIHCVYSRLAKDSVHSLALHVLCFFQMCMNNSHSWGKPRSDFAYCVTYMKMYAFFSRWENKSRSRSGQGMEYNMSSLCFPTVFTLGHLPPEVQGENAFPPTPLPFCHFVEVSLWTRRIQKVSKAFHFAFDQACGWLHWFEEQAVQFFCTVILLHTFAQFLCVVSHSGMGPGKEAQSE